MPVIHPKLWLQLAAADALEQIGTAVANAVNEGRIPKSGNHATEEMIRLLRNINEKLENR